MPPRDPLRIAFLLLLLGLALPAALIAQTKAQQGRTDKDVRALPILAATWTGDFDGMRKRRLIRVLVVYNKTNYFIDKGTPRGITTDAFKLFEDWLNAKYKTGRLRIHVVLVPVRRDAIAELLLGGKGDIAVANLTVTPERLEKVDFSTPVAQNVNEIVVSGPTSPPIASAQDLSGREVFVRRDSIYHESLDKLNIELTRLGKPEVTPRWAPDTLEDEDLLEMLNAGLVQYVVVNDFLATFWAKVLPKIKLHPDVVLRKEADIAWAMRQGSPGLKAELDAFLATYPERSATRRMLFQAYLKSTRFVTNAASKEEMAKFQRLVTFFQSYADTYDMDYLLMAAQGYQESRLDQTAKSPVGAIGVMQVMPSTGQDMNVGDILKEEPNVHAGVKYMRFIIDRHFADQPMDRLNMGLFAFAAYNAGPARIQSLRKEAATKGLDPNKWFNNVEIVTSQRIGRETVTYVANIYKYYIAYKLVVENMAERRKAKEEVNTGR
jgi:membrane-bound lytic murein transglycosylase MltF